MAKKGNALFVCFGGMSNVGTLTGLAGYEAAKTSPGTMLFCLASLACGDPVVQQRLHDVERIVTVDGCPLVCARRVVERAGYRPDRSIILTQDAGIVKGSPASMGSQNISCALAVIRAALEGDEEL